jgi:type I restriction enzyme S subunit
LPDKGYSRHFKYLNESIFRIAPLAEQHQIAAKLDELLAQVDSIKTRLDTIPKILKRFRQSVLAAAVSGRLTEDWREFNSLTQLDFDKYQLLDSLPISWRCVPLGDYVENHDNNRVPISSTERENRKGKYPYYGASGQIDTIDSYTHDGGFILIGEDGANLLTRTKPIAFPVHGKVWVNNHAHVLRCKDGYENKYLEYFINSIDLTPWVSGSAQPKLNQKNMNQIPISVPPKQEQTEIVRRVEQLFTYADQIEQRVKDAQARVNHLTQSILAKAFRGELTADWRAQNPDLISGENSAEALLAKIKAERATKYIERKAMT